MIDPAAASSSSLEALGRQYEATAHNLANASTTGYKRLVSALMSTDAAAGDKTGGSGSGIVNNMSLDVTQGALVKTDRPLDVALSGPGFLVVETPQGPRYTRNGVLQVSATGQLVDSSGRTVAGESGPIVVPAGTPAAALTIGSDGRVAVGRNEIGRLRIVEFEKAERLIPEGSGLLRAPADAAPTPAAKTTVSQGFQEASNVNVVEELVSLITVSRLYEANLRSVQLRDERLKQILTVAMA